MTYFTALRQIFISQTRYTIYISSIIGLSILWYLSTDIQVMIGNYGYLHTGIDIALSLVTFFLFPLFLMALYHRGKVFGKEKKKHIGIFGIFGGILTTIISGSSCCGLTLAIYFGLMPVMNLLPYDGLELKILGLLGLLYGLHQVLKNLESCLVKKV